MANEQNLRPGEHIPTKEEAKRGGIASGESRRRKKLLRECLQELMQMEYNTAQGKKLGSEMLSAMLMKKAMSGDIKAFEVLRDTAGEKPVDKVMVADVDKSVIDEVEKMVNDAGASG
nr:MAG TPA: hypothetical protein [Caudoviricetes sp.]